MTEIITVMIAYVICFFITELAKWYVRTYCQDNPEIIWIWLDDDDDPEGGCRVRNENRIDVSVSSLSFGGCL